MAKKTFAERAPHLKNKRKVNKGGRPRKPIPDDTARRRVMAFRQMDVAAESIAKIMGVSVDHLYDAYPMEMEYGPILLDNAVLANLHKQLQTDDVRIVPGAMAYARSRIKAFAPAPTTGGSGHFGGGQLREMRFVIVNDPEEGLEEFRQEGDTIEVKGHEPGAIDPDPDKTS